MPIAKTMRAVQYDCFGGPDVLHVKNVPIPAIGVNSILVRVHGAGVGPGESPIRQGKVTIFSGKKFPASVGHEFAGVVEAVGASTTGTYKIGGNVWGLTPHATFGALAEYVSVPESRIAPAPQNFDLVEAGGLVSCGTTVVRALTREGSLKKGERLLIRGAGGGVGSLAIQYAKHIGAHVVALAGASSLEWMKQELGADEAFDHRTTALRDLGKFSVILDVVGKDIGELRGMLENGGRIVELGFDPDHLVRTVLYIVGSTFFGGPRVRAFSNDPSAADLAQLTKLVEEGIIRPVNEKVWDIEEIVEATKAIEKGGVKGKHVVRLA